MEYEVTIVTLVAMNIIKVSSTFILRRQAGNPTAMDKKKEFKHSIRTV